ncbi:flagellar assembly peptidoglycan hydrolase FlgJ [Vibrio kyushuensis]|uniref:flagellar assembly peptidoglycan hydrolase FlgJ n=1 Tax=Vibrio kyushuensis TaxID=2910249 RepID=UPI003D09B263
MINNGNDIGFIHDIAGLDKLRQKAVSGDEGDDQAALSAAAKQFEAIFTSMLFKSMREANAGFESGIMDSQNQQFYRQMLDDQMSSELSASGSLGLADMIVAQLSTGSIENSSAAAKDENFEEIMNNVQRNRELRETAPIATTAASVSKAQPTSFDSPESFITSMKPYATQAAKALGVDSSLLLAQAALETGWGQKVTQNSSGSSNNLFNIKADRSWKGDKVATQTLEYHQGVPVKESAAFRSYETYQDSFNDYVRFLNQNPRYSTALQKTGSSEEFIHGIHKAGYATDPEYANKILRVKQRIDQM